MPASPSRCEVYRSEGYDPTGEHSVRCNAAGEYCDSCELTVCAACHKELGVNHLRKKTPGRAVSFPPGQRAKRTN